MISQIITTIVLVALIGWVAYLHNEIDKLKNKTKYDSYEK